MGWNAIQTHIRDLFRHLEGYQKEQRSASNTVLSSTLNGREKQNGHFRMQPREKNCIENGYCGYIE